MQSSPGTGREGVWLGARAHQALAFVLSTSHSGLQCPGALISPSSAPQFPRGLSSTRMVISGTSS